MAFRSQQRTSHLKSTPTDPHTINVTVVQSGNADCFSIVENTTWNQGIWSKTDDSNLTLTMKGTDVSGMLRFKSSGVSQPEEFFLVAIGVDTSKPWRWCDLKVNAKDTDTGALIHQKYYNTDTDEYGKKTAHEKSVTHKSENTTEITVEYYTDDNPSSAYSLRLIVAIDLS